EHIDLVAEWPEGAALRYRERQKLPGQAETVRWSTVILKSERRLQISVCDGKTLAANPLVV
ncbi:hypothetical protein MJI69_28350, partial [Salmonella enterica subsp. enterica serovar Anatum]|nr:hypothetical protein [Salmonella enterica subsp. enterica serovar Anatum]